MSYGISTTLHATVLRQTILKHVYTFLENSRVVGRVENTLVLIPVPKSSGDCCTDVLFLFPGCQTPNLPLQHKVATLHHLFFQDKTTELSLYLTTEQVGTAGTVGLFSQLCDNHFRDSM